MNIYLNELRSLRRVTLLWAVALAAIAVFFLSLYPAFYRDAQDVVKMFKAYPPEVLKAFGASVDTIGSLPGFYAFLASYVILCAAIQAMQASTGVLAKEAAGKTADFLLTKPVSRTRVLTAKLLATLTALAFSNLVYIGVALAMANIVQQEPVDWTIFLLLTLAMPLVQLFFVGIGFLFAAVAPKIKSVLPLTLGTVFTFFFLGMLGSAISDEATRYITPFRYFDTGYIIAHAAYEGRFVLIALAVAVVTVAVGYLVYVRKDIHAV